MVDRAHLVLRVLRNRLLLLTKLVNSVLRWADRLDYFGVMVADIDHLLLREGATFVTHHGVLLVWVVQLRSIYALAIEEADELVLLTPLLLHLGLQTLDGDGFKLAEGRLEPAPVDASCDHRRSQHLWLFAAFSLLLGESVTGVTGLSRADLFLVLAPLG